MWNPVSKRVENLYDLKGITFILRIAWNGNHVTKLMHLSCYTNDKQMFSNKVRISKGSQSFASKTDSAMTNPPSFFLKKKRKDNRVIIQKVAPCDFFYKCLFPFVICVKEIYKHGQFLKDI